MDRNFKLAWAAGFFDGEAFIGLSRGVTKKTGRPFHAALIDVAQKKREPLDELVELFGGKIRTGKNWCGQIYYWRLGGKDTHRVLLEVQPYLIGKRQQAALVIEYCETLRGAQYHRVSDEMLLHRELIHSQLRVLNQRRRPVQAERLSEEAPKAEPLRMVR